MNQPLDILMVTGGAPLHGASPEEQALGGSETALVQAARALATRGHRVEVVCDCPRPGYFQGVIYQHQDRLASLALERRPQVLLISRYYTVLDLPWRAGLHVLWNHDILDRPRELANRLDRLDLCLVLSRFHAQDFQRRLPASRGLLSRTVNGLDLAFLDQAAAGVEPQPRKVTYVSRPERGLDYLLEHIWPELRRRFPDLELHLCGYDPGDDATVPEHVRRQARVAELIAASPGVRWLGRLAKGEYYRHLASCAALLYPCQFPEISCIAALEAQALGVPVVTSDDFALAETVRTAEFRAPGRPGAAGYQEAFLAIAARVLEQPSWARHLAGRAREQVRRAHDWRAVAAQWETMFQCKLERRAAAKPRSLAATLAINGDRLAAGRVVGVEPRAIGEPAPAPDPDETELLAGLAHRLSGLEPRAPVAVAAADDDRTAAELACLLPGLAVAPLREEAAPPEPWAGLVVRYQLERQLHPGAWLAGLLRRCRPDAVVLLVVAGGSWPLWVPGHGARLWDLDRERLESMLPGRLLRHAFAPLQLTRAEGHAFLAGRWLLQTEAAGPDPVEPDPMANIWRTRPAPAPVRQGVEHVGLV